MEEMHELCIAIEMGRFVAQDAAERIEETSRMVNRMFGYEPVYRQYSRFLKQMALQVQLLSDNPLPPRYLRPIRPWWLG